MWNITLVFLLLFFSGCTSSITKNFHIEDKIPNLTPQDLTTYPQYANPYLKNFTHKEHNQTQILNNFLKLYFAPWDNNYTSPISKEDALWPYMYKNKDMYGENYQSIKKEWFEDMITYSNMDNFNTVKQKAITITNTHLRVFPSHKPFFTPFTKAGEGFPFDYNENSSIKLNTPLYISHYTQDNAWAYVSSPSVSGWIDTKYIATVDDTLIQTFTKSKRLYVNVQDNISLYKDGHHQDTSFIATLFPLVGQKLAIIKKDFKNNGYISTIDANPHIIPFPLPFDAKNIARMIDRMIDVKYGWGGLYNNRDCSLLTQDFYKLFGKLLHRNSSAQKANGEYIDISTLSNEEKIKTIQNQAIPFETLFYFKGHIGIYLGIYNNQPLFFHSTWGIKIKDEERREGRILIGKSIISSLYLGNEYQEIDQNNRLIDKIEGFIILSN